MVVTIVYNGFALRLIFMLAKSVVKASVPAKDGISYGFAINLFFVFDATLGLVSFNNSPVSL